MLRPGNQFHPIPCQKGKPSYKTAAIAQIFPDPDPGKTPIAARKWAPPAPPITSKCTLFCAGAGMHSVEVTVVRKKYCGSSLQFFPAVEIDDDAVINYR
jgi:hypothetical protein